MIRPDFRTFCGKNDPVVTVTVPLLDMACLFGAGASAFFFSAAPSEAIADTASRITEVKIRGVFIVLPCTCLPQLSRTFRLSSRGKILDGRCAMLNEPISADGLSIAHRALAIDSLGRKRQRGTVEKPSQCLSEKQKKAGSVFGSGLSGSSPLRTSCSPRGRRNDR